MREISLTRRQLQTLLARRQISQQPPGQVIFYRDHLPAGIWVLAKGEVALEHVRQTADYVTGPSLLGVDELRRGTPYPYTAVVVTPAEIAFIGKEEFRALDRSEWLP